MVVLVKLTNKLSEQWLHTLTPLSLAHCVGVVLSLQRVPIKAAHPLKSSTLGITSILRFCSSTLFNSILSSTPLRVMATIDTEAKTGKEYGPVGYIYHLSSKKPIGPSGGKSDPANGTELVVHSKKEAQVLQFRFVCVKEFGHFGYIENVGNSKIIHPTEDNKLVLRDSKEKNVNALFTFDLERYTIMHRNGKHWHTEGDSPTPKDDTTCLLQANAVGSNATINDAAKFYFSNFDTHHL